VNEGKNINKCKPLKKKGHFMDFKAVIHLVTEKKTVHLGSEPRSPMP
jgi:hypothetical protein